MIGTSSCCKRRHAIANNRSFQNWHGVRPNSRRHNRSSRVALAEGWRGTDSAHHQAAYAALPDGRTFVALQFCRMGARRGYVSNARGLQLNVPNDLFNGRRRILESAAGPLVLQSPAESPASLPLPGGWANIDGRLGAVRLYGAGEICLHRSPAPRDGRLPSLHIERVCFPWLEGPLMFEADEVILDAGWTVLSSANSGQTRRFAADHLTARVDAPMPDLRAVRVRGADDRTYVLVANFGPAEALLPAGWCPEATAPLRLAPGRSTLLARE